MWAAARPELRRFFAIVPAILILCYAPAVLGTIGVMPRSSAAYDWIATYLLPMGLFLLVVTTDIPAIVRLGWGTIIMMLVGTFGVVVGAIVSFFTFRSILPPDAWTSFAVITGSWTGGGGNFAAVRESVQMPDTLTGPTIVVDATIGFAWLGVVLFMARHQNWVRRFYTPRENAAALEHMEDPGAEAAKEPLTGEGLAIVLGVGVPAAVMCMWAGNAAFAALENSVAASPMWNGVLSGYTLGIVLITLAATALSFTPMRRLDRLGATQIGYLTQYIFFASLGAQADLSSIVDMPALVLAGALWMAIHIAIMALASRIMRAPLYLPAVASIANISGPSTAAIVGAEYNKPLAALGLLLGLLGNLIGTWAGLGVAIVLRAAG